MYLSAILILCFLVLLAFSVRLKIHSLNKLYLEDIGPAPASFRFPPVTIILTAKDEEKKIDAAVRTMSRLDYPHLSIITVNDRSNDATPKILEDLAKENPAVKPVHIKELPDGWLGKTNALQQGLDIADGEWILFTDADIQFSDEVLKKAIFYCMATKTGHLTVYPEILFGSPLEKGFVSAFGMLFAIDRPSWMVENPGSSKHMGIGAFNLVQKKSMDTIGGFHHLKLSVDDDIRLGELLKAHGVRTKVAFGVNQVKVHWQEDLKSYVKGFEKNAFASINFNPFMLIYSLLGVFVFTILPMLTLLFASGLNRMAALGIICVQIFMLNEAKRNTKIGEQYVFLLPVSGLLLMVSILNSALTTFKLGGISWRQTFYPLSALKEHIKTRSAHIKRVRSDAHKDPK